MKKIICDFCNKDITNEKVYDEPEMYDMSYLELCEDCDVKYRSVRNELAKYRKEQIEKAENRVKTKRVELFKKMGVNKYEEESI